GLPAVPGYEILEELGRGGMGVVYKAHQLGLNRLVALKTVRRADRADPAGLVRFLREAEAVASVKHANVVQVYDLGTWTPRGTPEAGEQPFLALEYLPGGTLADRLRATGPLEEAAALVEKVARGVAAA